MTWSRSLREFVNRPRLKVGPSDCDDGPDCGIKGTERDDWFHLTCIQILKVLYPPREGKKK